MSWQDLLLTRPEQIDALLSKIRRVAVLGMRTPAHKHRPAFYVPAALQRMGLEIVPVSLHDREVDSILGAKVYHRLADIPGPVDLVDVFRRAVDLPPHLPDLLAKRPGAVWLQTGIHDDAFAEQLARAGIAVVQNHCLMVEYRHHALQPAG